MTVFHVRAGAACGGDGSESHPLNTIGEAARKARPGDEVVVHAGIYRESVDPAWGGSSDDCRITYRAAEGEERPVITGAEQVDFWQPEGDGVWRAEVPNDWFGDWNPYAETTEGDWIVYPDPKVSHRHLGDVYLDGKSFYEVDTLDEVRQPKRRTEGLDVATNTMVPLCDPEGTLWVWHAEVGATATTIWANFHDVDPNVRNVEINVRKTCFTPSRLHLDYITVRGFEMCQAACPYAPPTGDQIGMLGPRWAKGWIIEDNVLHDAKCSAVSLGKEHSTGDNDCTRTRRKSGYQYQQEAVFKALRIGWSKDTIGSHIVRDNLIYDCGQNGVVGHLGCINSLIEHNHIHHIGAKREWFGWEVGAIKLHAAIDATIRGNRVHDSVLGMWLDWQAQGTRVSSNVWYRNTRDVMVEVSHGPCLIDNNVFASDICFDDSAQGSAFVNNLFCGRIRREAFLIRSTPYHFPHSTAVMGSAFTYGGDNRYANNLFAPAPGVECGTAIYDGHPTSMDEYVRLVEAKGVGDEELSREVLQPMYVWNNAYLGEAKPFDKETGAIVDPDCQPAVTLREEQDGVWIDITVGEAVAAEEACAPLVGTADLGEPRIAEERYENPDGTPLTVDRDILGAPRAARSACGPFAHLRPGHNTLEAWK